MAGEEDDEAVDETVMLTRRARRQAGQAPADPPSAEDAVDDSTVVIDRSGLDEQTVVIPRPASDEHTVVVPRPASDEDTVVVPRPASDEHTLVVDRSRPADAGTPDLDPSLMDTIAAPPRREVVDPAPAIYKPRPAPRIPSRPPAVTGGEPATRDTAAVTASVVRRSRRAGALAVICVAGACIVSVAGLVTLGVLLLG